MAEFKTTRVNEGLPIDVFDVSHALANFQNTSSVPALSVERGTDLSHY